MRGLLPISSVVAQVEATRPVGDAVTSHLCHGEYSGTDNSRLAAADRAPAALLHPVADLCRRRRARRLSRRLRLRQRVASRDLRRRRPDRRSRRAPARRCDVTRPVPQPADRRRHAARPRPPRRAAPATQQHPGPSPGRSRLRCRHPRGTETSVYCI